MVTSAVGSRLLCRARMPGLVSPVRVSSVHGMPRSCSGWRERLGVSAASARSGVIQRTRSGGAAARDCAGACRSGQDVTALACPSPPAIPSAAPPGGERLPRSGRGVHQPTLAGEIRAPHLALEVERRPAARREPPLGGERGPSLSRASSICAQRLDACPLRTPACPCATAAMRGKRTATPDLWRGERWIPSKASSNTCSGSTWRTGPNFSTVFRRIHASSLRISASVSPEYAFANGTSASPSHTAKV